MLKIRVTETIDDIKRILSPIKNEICIVHNRKENDYFIVTPNSNLRFIQTNLSVLGFEDFVDRDRTDFFFSNDDILLIGRADFMQ